ncbi:uncharacterized protein EI90DRAFT_2060026 [Cantharellus anzutake]|uniref:uncharacterized protein n=1 Tax=Cantharellus anzutake TaxID=1750568 RepID=UPI0019038F31|nr:uncharacterized protein EI90DRAFT_2060026 [Cantharellus anzutake]KAF8340397.1 hypothetical protein EI90DRAFT_2060026 [Cantharellus anzutake]
MKSFNALTSTHPDSRRRSRCRGSVSRPSSPLRNRDISGCLICRLRKKRCSLGSEGKNNGSCSECSKFHIECFGAGLSRPPVGIISRQGRNGDSAALTDRQGTGAEHNKPLDKGEEMEIGPPIAPPTAPSCIAKP